MAKIKYLVVQKSFIDGIFIDPFDANKWDDERKPYVELDESIVPGPNLQATDDKGKAAKGKFKEQSKADAKRMSQAAEGVESFAEA